LDPYLDYQKIISKSEQPSARLDDHPITGDQMAAIGNQIDAAFVFARSDLVNVCDPEKTQTMKKPMTRSRAAKKKALAITRAKPNKRSAVSTRTKPPTPFDRCTRAREAAQTY